MPSSDPQHWLFEPPPQRIESVPARAEHLQLAAALPPDVRFGAMTWSYRGWVGTVYAKDAPERDLARYGLTAYTTQPLLQLAEIDRTYYGPLRASEFREYAEQVPTEFRFLVKAHEVCTVQRFPMHARYGEKRGQDNPTYLDAEYAQRAVIDPLTAGLGDRTLAVLWQFSPHDVRNPRAFAAELNAFLRRISGVRSAVELRNRELLTPEYGAALADAGAIHCHNAWTSMPSVLAQARALPPSTRRPLLIRWLLRPNESYEEANARYLPFDKIVEEDLETRDEVATLITKAHAHGVPAYTLVDNKAEGSAPESIARLARCVVEQLHRTP